MLTIFKKTTAALVLVSFLTIALFSLATMVHEPDGRMSGDCPFSTIGQSLCPQDVLAITIHHISAYHGFLNVLIGVNLTLLIAFLLFVIYILPAIFIHSELFGPPILIPISQYFLPTSSNGRKVTRWLSLFENSPSLN